jgi:hypothetical protein
MMRADMVWSVMTTPSAMAAGKVVSAPARHNFVQPRQQLKG